MTLTLPTWLSPATREARLLAHAHLESCAVCTRPFDMCPLASKLWNEYVVLRERDRRGLAG